MERKQIKERFDYESTMIHDFYYRIKQLDNQDDLCELIEQQAKRYVPTHMDSTTIRNIDSYCLYATYKDTINKCQDLTTLDKIFRKLLYFYNKEVLIENIPDKQGILILNYFSNTIDPIRDVIEIYQKENTTIVQVISCTNLYLLTIQTIKNIIKIEKMLCIDNFKGRPTELITATVATTIAKVLTEQESEN